VTADAPETARLRLRRLTPDDESALFEVFADPYAREFYPQMSDPIHVQGWIAWNLRNYEAHVFGLWAVELRSSGRLIGDCGLTYQDVEGTRELEIGYHVVEAERRKGYATEAARACLDFGFRRTSSAMICSIVSASNAASQTVAERVHVQRREFTENEKPRVLFSTERHDWDARPR